MGISIEMEMPSILVIHNLTAVFIDLVDASEAAVAL